MLSLSWSLMGSFGELLLVFSAYLLGRWFFGSAITGTRSSRNFLPRSHCQMWIPRIVSGVALTGLLIAQEIPSPGDWTKAPVEVICALALAWVACVTFPKMNEKHREEREKRDKDNKEHLDRVLDSHTLAHKQMSVMMGEKLQQQTETLSRVIRESSRN